MKIDVEERSMHYLRGYLNAIWVTEENNGRSNALEELCNLVDLLIGDKDEDK